jgi:hypothetical protein
MQQTDISASARFYVLLVNGCTPNGQHRLPLPTARTAGDWFDIPEGLEITDDPTAAWRDRARLYTVEVDTDDHSRARLVRFVTPAQMELLGIYTSGRHAVIAGSCAVSGTATVDASGDVIVFASGRSTTIARGSVVVHARDYATGRCYGKTTLNATDNTSFSLFEECAGKASGKARITGRGYCKVDAVDQSHVDLFDFCEAIAEGCPVIRGYNRSRIWASDLSKVKTFDQAKAFVRDGVRATADGSSQIFAAPGTSVKPLNFAGVTRLHSWTELTRLTS